MKKDTLMLSDFFLVPAAVWSHHSPPPYGGADTTLTLSDVLTLVADRHRRANARCPGRWCYSLN